MGPHLTVSVIVTYIISTNLYHEISKVLRIVLNPDWCPQKGDIWHRQTQREGDVETQGECPVNTGE